MPRAARSRLTPWIESLILRYGNREEEQEQEKEETGKEEEKKEKETGKETGKETEKEEMEETGKETEMEETGKETGAAASSSSQFKAHVIGVGQMSESQAQGSEGPTGLLFLSDGALQIPAVLTASAWEHLQEQEDRESFSSLVNTTVCIQDYRLCFHMAPQQIKCLFFLSVGELATTAAGPVQDNPPCCSTRPSVRRQVSETWRSLLGREEVRRSPCGFDLSELLGEWQHDCLQAVLEDVRDRLQPPSTCTSTSSPGRRATGWDRDRVQYRGAERFSVAVKRLLISEDVGGRSQQTAESAATEDVYDCSPPLLVDDVTDRCPSRLWDMFPPPCVSSSSSPETTPSVPLDRSAAAVLNGTQLPVQESSFFPPYQNQPSTPAPTSTLATASSSLTPPEDQQSIAAVDRQSEDTEGQHRKAKRKRSDPPVEGAELSSLPSWLFDSEAGGCRFEEGSGPQRAAGRRTRPSFHGDGKLFSYCYQVTGQNLQDFSRVRVGELLLRWAVRYLVTPTETHL
ncbi:adrenocortical dysplasia protein homolog [Brachyistius frenatus]|uniref:adrenocortical dysplasia protein homolog n=1 Tax=Brachyistius frenatus TaxID=100188 RepID=UPI0037E8A541